MKTYKTLEAAAKAHGAAHGVTGKAGGWIYRNGVAICQGWRSYGYLLVDAGLIDPQDRDGDSVRRFKVPGGSLVRSRAHWRARAEQYAITDEG